MTDIIEVRKSIHHVLVSADVLADVDGWRESLSNLLFSPPRPTPPPFLGPHRPPDLWLSLLVADLDPLARAVLDLHHPTAYERGDGTVAWWECDGCDFDGYEAESPRWPCRTATLVADFAGVGEVRP